MQTEKNKNDNTQNFSPGYNSMLSLPVVYVAITSFCKSSFWFCVVIFLYNISYFVVEIFQTKKRQ
jgi:hypothetical protein